MDGGFNLVNNVTFNWWNRSVDGGDENSRLNIINNYFKPGPITPKDKPIAHRIVKPESSRDKNKPDTFGKAYVSGNVVEEMPVSPMIIGMVAYKYMICLMPVNSRNR